MFAKWMVMKKYEVPDTESNLSKPGVLSVLGTRLVLIVLAVSLFLSGVTSVFAQDQTQAPAQDNTQSNGKPKQDVPTEAGGPTGNIGPYTIHKKNPEEAPPPPPPPAAPNKIEGMPDYSIKVNVPLVNVDVMVSLKNNGQFVSGLKKENFRLYEDGAEQK